MAMNRNAQQQGCVQQTGGNKEQVSILEYSRGNKMYRFEIKPGSSHFIPKDAKNVLINGRPASAGQKATVSPYGEIRWT